MHRRVRVLGIHSLTALALAAASLLAGPLADPAAASASSTYESDVIKYANVERSKRDLAKVSPSACLDSYAESWARNMAKKQRMYHQELGPILSKCKLSQVGENIAFGYVSGKSVTKAWIASPAHKANLLNKRHRLIGVGAVQDSHGYWWVSEVLGRSR
jgi:uncharacterized protein YkwD